MNVRRNLYLSAACHESLRKEGGPVLFPLLQILHNLLPLLKFTPSAITGHVQQHNLGLPAFCTSNSVRVHLRGFPAFVARTTYFVIHKCVYE